MSTNEVTYMRCSSWSQDFDLQERELLQAFPEASERSLRLQDVESGSKVSRPAYDRLKKLIRLRRCKCVYVYNWDRIARTVAELLDFVRLCKEYDCDIKSVKNQIPIKGTIGDAMIAMLGIAAQLERDAINFRRNSALRKKMKEEGWRPGGSNKGWFSEKVIKKAPAIYALLDAGESINYIAKHLRTDHRIIKRLIYHRENNLPLTRFNRKSVNFKKPLRDDLYQMKE